MRLELDASRQRSRHLRQVTRELPAPPLSSEGRSVDQTHPDLSTAKPPVLPEGVICCCSGAVIVLVAEQWSDFALGQLIALGIGTFIVALVALVLIVCPIW
jgi:hypothetical protein